jgi:flagellar motor switch protein FliG
MADDALPVPAGDAKPARRPTASGPMPPPPQRAAALVLAIGSGKASTILDHLDPDEVALLAEEVAHLGDIDSATRNAYMATTLTHMMDIDPVEEARILRARAQAMAAAAELADFEHFDPLQPFKFLQKVELDQAVQFLTNEHPQTAAVILAAQPPGFAAKVLAQFEPEHAGDISLRIATIGKTPQDVIYRIEQAMRKRLTEAEEGGGESRDGPRELAAILNNADREIEEKVMEHLHSVDRELAEYVRSLMFVFEDITTLDDRAIQQILQQVNTQALALALKGAEDLVRDKITTNLSERARDALLEEYDLLGAVRKQDVMEARASIVATIRSLEANGQIVIARGDDSEFIE